jgi:hypothetical protein
VGSGGDSAWTPSRCRPSNNQQDNYIHTHTQTWQTNSTVHCKLLLPINSSHSVLTHFTSQRSSSTPKPKEHGHQPLSHLQPGPRTRRRTPRIRRPTSRSPPLQKVRPRLPALRLQPRWRQLPQPLEQRIRPSRRRCRDELRARPPPRSPRK